MVTRFRTKTAARDGVVEMIARDIQNSAIECQFNVNSPDGDLAKFTTNGKVARAYMSLMGIICQLGWSGLLAKWCYLG